ncbi:MAG TPA: DUF6515 family protein [Thermoleophilaceae bacterium]|nr:DUF6515 family protein [Thermoleophilaceae bacterium]
MASKPPNSRLIARGSSLNHYYGGAYYSRVSYGGSVQYQVIDAPPGAIITTLPGGCTTYMRGGVAYRQCGRTYYQQVSGGFQVVVF